MSVPRGTPPHWRTPQSNVGSPVSREGRGLPTLSPRRIRLLVVSNCLFSAAHTPSNAFSLSFISFSVGALTIVATFAGTTDFAGVPISPKASTNDIFLLRQRYTTNALGP